MPKKIPLEIPVDFFKSDELEMVSGMSKDLCIKLYKSYHRIHLLLNTYFNHGPNIDTPYLRLLMIQDGMRHIQEKDFYIDKASESMVFNLINGINTMFPSIDPHRSPIIRYEDTPAVLLYLYRLYSHTYQNFEP